MGRSEAGAVAREANAIRAKAATSRARLANCAGRRTGRAARIVVAAPAWTPRQCDVQAPCARRVVRTAASALACSTLMAAVACGGAEDSGGNAAAGGLNGPDVMLTAVTEPVYTVGKPAGEDWELLGRVASLAFDDGGSLYLFDAVAQRIVVVGPDGQFAGFAGGPGEGPGEFDNASAMALLPGGRIAVFEFGLPGTFEILEADGTYVESVQVDITKAAPAAKAEPLPDGRLISTGGPRVSMARAPDQDGEVAPPGRRAMDIFPLDGADPGAFYYAWGPPPAKGDSTTVQLEEGMMFTLPPQTALEPGLHWAVLADGRIAIADSIGYQVKLVTPDGADAGRIERPIEPLTVTEAVRDAVRAAARADLEGAASLGVTAAYETAMPPALREAMERGIEEMTFPNEIPVVAGLAADREGRLWIERSGLDGVADGPIDIVTPDGGYVGTLAPDGPRLPNAFGPGGLMAYLVEDDMGAQTVRVVRLASLDR